MNPANQQYLEDNMQHLINARADFFKHLGGETRSNFERIMSEEFRPGYRADLGCDKCALEMMKILGIHYQQWKDSQPPPEPVTVNANFPSHKPKK